MKISEAVALVGKIVAYYPYSKVTADTLTLYAEDLAESYRADVLSEGLRAVVRACKYFPTLAEIREACDAAAIKLVEDGRRLAAEQREVTEARKAIEAGCPHEYVWATNPEGSRIYSTRTVVIIGQRMTFHKLLEIGGITEPVMPASDRDAWLRAAECAWRRRAEDRLVVAQTRVSSGQRQLPDPGHSGGTPCQVNRP